LETGNGLKEINSGYSKEKSIIFKTIPTGESVEGSEM
jgi:hypothetical protein